MKICFIISSLKAGGAEKVASILCNYWIRNGHNVNIITFDKPESSPHFKIHKKIKIHQLNVLKQSTFIIDSTYQTLKRVVLIRKKYNELDPDIIISFMTETNILAILANVFLSAPLIISERIHPAFHSIGSIKSKLRNILYKYADITVVQTEDIKKWVEINTKSNVVVVPNPVEIPSTSRSKKITDYKESNKYILGVGRLTHQKGFDVLIRAFSEVAVTNKDWILVICGEGEEREKLTNLISECQLEGRVLLIGKKEDIYHELSKADIFILSSRYEGFPNTLLEAMSSGLPVISTDCPGGAGEIIENGINGILTPVDNVESLSSSINLLINDHKTRDKLGRNARNVLKIYGIEKIIGQWEDLIENLIDKKL